MKFTETKLKGAFLIDFEKREDNRGFFARAFCQKEFADHGLETEIRQANSSYNFKKGTLRGMHRQVDPYQEVKIIRCTRGAIWDCIIDLRKNSPTYKQWIGAELTQDNHRTLYVPKDFGHGYLTLTDHAEVIYLVTQMYVPNAESGLRWDDPAFGIKWPGQIDLSLMTEKDRTWPDYKG
jgi:dTDP-4-dehydrorhamnose 3,5-epimerase